MISTRLISSICAFTLGLTLIPSVGIACTVRPEVSQLKTDKKLYAEPPLPALPRAGGKFKDPTFGTEILRVTDEASATEGGTFYSYWPTFNSDNSRMLVKTATDGTASVYAFDPRTVTIGSRKTIPASPAGYPNVESAIWSGSDPDTLFALVGLKIYAFHPSTSSYTLVADLSSQFPRGDFLWQLSLSRKNDDVFAFARRRPNASGGSDYVGYGAYSRSQKALVLNQEIQKNDLDEVQVNKTGRWLIVKGESKTTKGFSIRDLKNNGDRRQLRYGAPDYALAHSDNGANFVSGFNNYLNSIDRRNFVDLSTITALSLGTDWSQGMHISHIADDDSWILVSLFEVAKVSKPLGPFHNEIFLVKTDGSASVIRLVHHRSVYKSYYDSPRANISQDGRFVAFTSNWGGRARRDMFIAVVPRSS